MGHGQRGCAPLTRLEILGWIRCPVCGRNLGQRAGELALVHHQGRRALALFVACHGPGCRGSWTSAAGRALLDRARGLELVG